MKNPLSKMNAPQILKAALFNDTTLTTHYGCATVLDEIILQLDRVGINIVLFWPVGDDWRPYRKELETRLETIDLIIINGEGSIHHTEERPRARWLLELADLAESADLPAFMLNTTISNVEPRFITSLRKFKGIWVRESGSKRYLDELGVKSTVVPDLAIHAVARYVKSLDYNPPSRPEGRVLVTDSAVQEVSRHLRSLANEIGATYTHMYKDSLFERRARRTIRKILPDDLLIYRKLTGVARPDVKYVDWIRRLSQYAFVITGRFHTAAFCIAMNIPFLAVESNTSKISTLVYDVFGSRNRFTEVRSLTEFYCTRKSQITDISSDEEFLLSSYRDFSLSSTELMFRMIRRGSTEWVPKSLGTSVS